MSSTLIQVATRHARLLALSLALIGSAQASPILMLSLTKSEAAALGDTISLDLVVTDVADLYGFDFSLQFDAAVLHGVSVNERPAFSSAGTTFFVAGTFDNAAGTLGLTGNTLIGPIAGFTGSGVLASINFLAVGSGTSAVLLNDVGLLNSSFSFIPTTVNSASITVDGATGVPEPGSLALALTALAALGCAGLRRGRSLSSGAA